MSKLIPVPYYSKSRILSVPSLAPFWLEKAVDCDSGSNLDREISLVEKTDWFCRPLLEWEMETSLTSQCVHGDPEPVRRWIKKEAIKYNTRIIHVVNRKMGVRTKDVVFAFVIGNPDHLLVEKPVLDQLKWLAKHLKSTLRGLI